MSFADSRGTKKVQSPEKSGDCTWDSTFTTIVIASAAKQHLHPLRAVRCLSAGLQGIASSHALSAHSAGARWATALLAMTVADQTCEVSKTSQVLLATTI